MKHHFVFNELFAAIHAACPSVIDIRPWQNAGIYNITIDFENDEHIELGNVGNLSKIELLALVSSACDKPF
ncbi:MAG: hypothetical protein RSH79_04900 [Clostridiales bacterium]